MLAATTTAVQCSAAARLAGGGAVALTGLALALEAIVGLSLLGTPF